MDAAVGVIVGAIIGFLGSALNNWIQTESMAKERFFYEIYPKRIELYEEIIKELQSMMKLDFKEHIHMTGIKASEKCLAWLHILNPLIARIRLFGSGNAFEVLAKFRDLLLGLQTKYLEMPTVGDADNASILCGVVELTLNGFTLVIEEEAGANFVDETLKKFKKTKKHGKSVKENPNPVPGDTPQDGRQGQPLN